MFETRKQLLKKINDLEQELYLERHKENKTGFINAGRRRGCRTFLFCTLFCCEAKQSADCVANDSSTDVMWHWTLGSRRSRIRLAERTVAAGNTTACFAGGE